MPLDYPTPEQALAVWEQLRRGEFVITNDLILDRLMKILKGDERNLLVNSLRTCPNPAQAGMFDLYVATLQSGLRGGMPPFEMAHPNVTPVESLRQGSDRLPPMRVDWEPGNMTCTVYPPSAW